jgi:hypothetical protein
VTERLRARNWGSAEWTEALFEGDETLEQIMCAILGDRLHFQNLHVQQLLDGADGPEWLDWDER